MRAEEVWRELAFGAGGLSVRRGGEVGPELRLSCWCSLIPFEFTFVFLVGVRMSNSAQIGTTVGRNRTM